MKVLHQIIRRNNSGVGAAMDNALRREGKSAYGDWYVGSNGKPTNTYLDEVAVMPNEAQARQIAAREQAAFDKDTQAFNDAMSIGDRTGYYNGILPAVLSRYDKQKNLEEYGTINPKKTIVERVTDPIGRYVVPAAMATGAVVGMANAPLTFPIALGAGMVGGTAVNAGVENISDGKYESVGDYMKQNYGVNNNLGEMLNPGYLVGGAASKPLANTGRAFIDPRYRAEVAYRTIFPRGYDKPFSRAFKYAKGLVLDHSKMMHRDFDHQIQREVAFRKYLGLPLEEVPLRDADKIYAPNNDGTFSYKFDREFLDDALGSNSTFGWPTRQNLIDLNEAYQNSLFLESPIRYNGKLIAENLLKPNYLESAKEGWKGKDFINGNAGNLGQNEFINANYNPVSNTTRLTHRISDTWDINPFGYKYDLGFLLGGKPFKMRTDIPLEYSGNLDSDVANNMFDPAKLRVIGEEIQNSKYAPMYRNDFPFKREEMNSKPTYNLEPSKPINNPEPSKPIEINHFNPGILPPPPPEVNIIYRQGGLIKRRKI